MKPHVTFHISKELDKQMIPQFLGRFGQKAGADFEGWVLKDHPKLKGRSEDRKFNNDYVDSYYKNNRKLLLDKKKIFQQKWDIVEDDFLDLVDEVFNKQPWPDGNYKGYISIIQCGPRMLKTKEFQSSFKWERNLVSQVIHEMLHFQFYEAAQLSVTNMGPDKKWTLSEIFNDIIQNEESFIKIQGHKVGISYPDHAREHQKYKKVWQETRDIQKFIIMAQ